MAVGLAFISGSPESLPDKSSFDSATATAIRRCALNATGLVRNAHDSHLSYYTILSESRRVNINRFNVYVCYNKSNQSRVLHMRPNNIIIAWH